MIALLFKWFVSFRSTTNTQLSFFSFYFFLLELIKRTGILNRCVQRPRTCSSSSRLKSGWHRWSCRVTSTTSSRLAWRRWTPWHASLTPTFLDWESSCWDTSARSWIASRPCGPSCPSACLKDSSCERFLLLPLLLRQQKKYRWGIYTEGKLNKHAENWSSETTGVDPQQHFVMVEKAKFQKKKIKKK